MLYVIFYVHSSNKVEIKGIFVFIPFLKFVIIAYSIPSLRSRCIVPNFHSYNSPSLYF